ncbi:MAG: signal peptidase I [Clostridia bacterium]|nr:signal peptidase I [Clostridia bacterium]
MDIVRKLFNIISTLMIIGLLILTILLVGVRAVGLTPYAVLSGSMEPTYHVGSLIYVKKIAPENITVGMPITFVVNKDLLVATHRVIDVECRTFQYEQVKDEEGNLLYEEDGDPLVERVDLEEPAYYYTTKGDANDVVDGSAVYYKNVIGTPIFSAPYLGYFSSWLQTRKGTIISICALLILLILTFLPDVLRMVDDDPPAQKPEKKKKAAAKTRKQPADASAQPQRKKRPLTQEEREMIIAGRKERGEELRGPLTQEERELIIAKRKQEARERRLSAASAEASVQTPDQTGDTAQQVRRRRRRTDSSDGEN